MSDGITYDRGAGPIKLSLIGEHWWVTYLERRIEDYYTPADVMEAQYDGRELPEGLIMTQINDHQLLAMLNHSELRDLLGYCAHLVEQNTTFISEIVRNMGDAVTAKDWDTLRGLNISLEDTILANATAKAMSQRIYDLDRGEVL